MKYNSVLNKSCLFCILEQKEVTLLDILYIAIIFLYRLFTWPHGTQRLRPELHELTE